ncbi:unnamed protein product [Closterium sp. Yama58-4]|nr:unnamed protein product [Closterium sp. Yama58-4]
MSRVKPPQPAAAVVAGREGDNVERDSKEIIGKGVGAKGSVQGEQQGGEAERRRAAGKSSGEAVGVGGAGVACTQQGEQDEQGRVEGEGREGQGERRQGEGGASGEAMEAVAAVGGGEGDAGEVLDGDCGASAVACWGGGTLGSEWSEGRGDKAFPVGQGVAAAAPAAVAAVGDACGAGGSGSEGAGRGVVGEGSGGASSSGGGGVGVPGRQSSGAALPAGSTTVPAGSTAESAQQGDRRKDPVLNQVEVFIREHLRPLERSGVISAEQRRWVASKAAGKVMERHGGARSAAFLVKEGEDVRRLAERYLRTYHVRFSTSNGGNAPPPSSSSPPAG